MTATPEELPAIDKDAEELGDHPDEVGFDEVQRGFLMYRAVDDTNDDSNGLD